MVSTKNMMKLCYSMLVLLLVITSCNKNTDYYNDSGLANPFFEGTVMDYLESKPFYFDSLAIIAEISGLDSVLREKSITFFASPDRSIQTLIRETNNQLNQDNFDTIRTLQDVPPEIWFKYLGRYIFKGTNGLKDYPQIDYNRLNEYPGQTYLSWNETPMNIGVVYHDVNKVKYAGYRQLTINYVFDLTNPINVDSWLRANVSSVDILTDNAQIHTLTVDQFFGFSVEEFTDDMKRVFDE